MPSTTAATAADGGGAAADRLHAVRSRDHGRDFGATSCRALYSAMDSCDQLSDIEWLGNEAIGFCQLNF
jgi:hypothetical protein